MSCSARQLCSSSAVGCNVMSRWALPVQRNPARQGFPSVVHKGRLPCLEKRAGSVGMPRQQSCCCCTLAHMDKAPCCCKTIVVETVWCSVHNHACRTAACRSSPCRGD